MLMKLARRARVAAVAEAAAVSVVSGASRAGKRAFKAAAVHSRRQRYLESGLRRGNHQWRPSRSARRKCGGWNAKGIRLPNARRSRPERPPESRLSQIPIPKHPKTLRHRTPRQIYQSTIEAILGRRKGELVEIRYLGF